jgi:hypothetical protein
VLRLAAEAGPPAPTGAAAGLKAKRSGKLQDRVESLAQDRQDEHEHASSSPVLNQQSQLHPMQQMIADGANAAIQEKMTQRGAVGTDDLGSILHRIRAMAMEADGTAPAKGAAKPAAKSGSAKSSKSSSVLEKLLDELRTLVGKPGTAGK